MLLSWSGKNWTASQAPAPWRNTSQSADAQVNGMACPSTTTCLGVGAYSATNQEYGLLLRWSGDKWTAATAPTPAGSPAICPQCPVVPVHHPVLCRRRVRLWSSDAAADPAVVL